MKKIGRYQVLREIGRGGMATVFLARDLFSGRRVAIKVLPPQFTHDPRFRAQFKREAKAIAALEHAYITPVYDFGEEENQPYIVMRYMPGGTLADRLVGQALPLEAIIPIVQRVAEGLDVAHRRSIIHRDLKPRNVLFDDEGQPFLSDFGVAKTGDGSATISSLGLFGTPAYISPEQADGSRKLDGRSDVYSLGVIVYEMLTGHRPFSAETPMGLMLKHATEPMPPIDTESLGLPAEVNTVLGKTLSKKPEDRYQTAGEFAEALSAFSRSPTPTRVPVLELPPSQKLGQPARSAVLFSPLFWMVGGGIGLFVLLAAAALAFVLNGAGGPTATPSPTIPPPATATFILPPSATALLPATPTAGRTHTKTPSATRSPSATRTRTPTQTATSTPSPTATRRPPTATPPPPPTLALSPTPVCVPPEFFDPIQNRCVLPGPPPDTPTLSPP